MLRPVLIATVLSTAATALIQDVQVSGASQVATAANAPLSQPRWTPIGPLEEQGSGGGYGDAGASGLGVALSGVGGASVTAQRLGSAAGQIGVQQSGCPNVLSNEPVVMFEVSGATLLGEVHRQLTVYGNGRATLAEKIGNGFSRVATTVTSLAEVNNLRVGLAAHGAFTTCDQEVLVFDVPLRTITVFDGTTDARAHTVNYWLNSDVYAGMDELLEEFITGHFNEE